MEFSKEKQLIEGPLKLVGLGIESIVEGAKAAGASVIEATFQPPAGGDQDRMRALAKLFAPPLADEIDAANQLSLTRLMESRPTVVGVGVARDVIPGMSDDLILHAGPPITWERMSGPLRGAIVGGLIYEGKAKTPEEAEQLAASGKIRFDPCHHHHAVGPMAGVVTASMPVWIVEDMAGANAGNRTYCTLNEGLGKVLRFGAYSDEVITRLKFIERTLGPLLGRTLEGRGPIDLKMIMAQALQMGDEGHNRNRAGTSLLFRELAPAMVRFGGDAEDVAKCLDFISKNDHFILNLTMPMAKCMLMATEGIEHATVLSVMARNGTDFGIQVASMPGRWFTGPAQLIRGLYFPGFTDEQANPDIGDSAITETAGFGAFCMAAAPAIVQFVGGTVNDALKNSRQMGRITVGKNQLFQIPALGFEGSPTGIDVRLVEEKNVLPVINTGIAHKAAGVGQVGAGLVSPPWECFHQALMAIAGKEVR